MLNLVISHLQCQMPGKIFKEKEKKNTLVILWKEFESIYNHFSSWPFLLLSQRIWSSPVESLEMALSLLISLVSYLQGHWSTKHPRSLQPQLRGPQLEPRLLAFPLAPRSSVEPVLIQFWGFRLLGSRHSEATIILLAKARESVLFMTRSLGTGSPERAKCFRRLNSCRFGDQLTKGRLSISGSGCRSTAPPTRLPEGTRYRMCSRQACCGGLHH